MFCVLKRIFVLLSAFFLLSCDSKESTSASGGTAAETGQKLVFSKTCAAGSINVHHTPTTLAGATTLGGLNVGDKVSISGSITEGSCGVTGPISFTCSAVVKIINNRAYVCESGSLGPSVAAGVGTAAAEQAIIAGGANLSSFGVVNQHRPFVGGSFMAHENGTSLFGRIIVGPSQWNFGNCPISFSCSSNTNTVGAYPTY